VPPELDGRAALLDELDAGATVTRVPFGAEAAVSAFARVVVLAAAAEVLLRGFALPKLIGWRGPIPAVAITAVLTAVPLAFATGGPGGPVLLPIVLALGTSLALLYIATRSLLPGVALSTLACGFMLGQAYGWSVAGSFALAAGCCALALVFAWALVRE